MSQIPIRPMAPNPRTDERPMAFTGGEYLRGLLWTLLIFNVGFPVMLVLTTLVGELVSALIDGSRPVLDFSTFDGFAAFLPMMWIVIVPISAFTAVTYGGAAAYGLGWALRRIANRAVHRTLFAILGVVVGAAAVLLYGGMSGSVSSLFGSVIPAALMTGIAVLSGWEITSRKALRRPRP